MAIEKRSGAAVLKAVLFALVLREVRSRLSTRRFGAFWLIFEPLSHVVLLMVIYSFLRGHGNQGISLPMFLVTGVIPFILFKNISLKGMEAVAANKALFSYRQIKPMDAVLARAIVESALMICVYAAVIFGLAMWLGIDVSIHHPIEWLGVLSVGIVFSFGLALVYCILGEMFPEIKAIIRLAYLPIYLISGVIVPIWVIPEQLYPYISWNPYLHLVDLLRQNVFENYPKTFDSSLSYVISVSLVIVFIGLALYRARRFRLVAL